MAEAPVKIVFCIKIAPAIKADVVVKPAINAEVKIGCNGGS